MSQESNLVKKAFLSGGGLGIARLVTGLIRIKYLALVVGTAGIGVISQANIFYILAISLTSFSMAGGIVNRIRDPRRADRPEAVAVTQGTALISIGFLCIFFLAIFLLYSEEIISYSFQGHLGFSEFWPVLIGLPFSAFAAGYFEAIFLSRDRYDLYVRSSIVATVFELIAYLVLIYFYQLQGALIAIGLSGIIIFFSYLVYLPKLKEPIGSLFSLQFRFDELSMILKFSIAILSGSALGYFANLWIRANIIRELGVDENGILQTAVSLSAYTLPLITNGIWGHLHPKTSATGDTESGRGELGKVLRLVMLMSCAISLSFIYFGEVFIALVYSKEFLAGFDLFSYQLVGDFFFFIFFAVAAYFFSTSQLRNYFKVWCLYYVGLFMGVELLVSRWGILSYSLAHLIVSLVICLGLAAWLSSNKLVSKQNIEIFSKCLGLLLISCGLVYMEAGYLLMLPLYLLSLFVLYRSGLRFSGI